MEVLTRGVCTIHFERFNCYIVYRLDYQPLFGKMSPRTRESGGHRAYIVYGSHYMFLFSRTLLDFASLLIFLDNEARNCLPCVC